MGLYLMLEFGYIGVIIDGRHQVYVLHLSWEMLMKEMIV
jgi:hypothetical protein